MKIDHIRFCISELGKLLSGHCDRPRSRLLVEMHGKWPMAGCYFALCVDVDSHTGKQVLMLQYVSAIL
jgi:hypothetical protein